ncbi:MAG: cytidine deaminase [Pseudomonadota bacterium]
MTDPAHTPPEALVAAARAAARNAHAPYSNFGVGAALLMDDGEIVSGTNIENASYGLSLCAEAVALGTANSLGRLRDIVAVAVVGGQIGADGALVGAVPVHPCGRCRQMLNEAAQLGRRDLPVYCASADGSAMVVRSLSELLPHGFGPADLAIG